MADEVQTQDPPAAAAPAPTVPDAAWTDALAANVTERLRAEFQSREPAPAPQPVQQQPEVDPVDKMLNPYLQPIRRAAALASESATDAAEFYTSHNELDKGTRQEIEKRFKALAAAGIAFKREDILNHYVGENIDKEVDKRIASRSAAAARANDAASMVGGGSPDRGGQGQITDARSMTTDALGKALEGQSF